MLAQGVFWSGVVKDLLCLPRPLSPPLQRITMSGSTALEYGFPSTHSTNAISVVVYVLHALRNTPSADRTMFHTVAQVAFCWYAISIMLGRLYCGMHGFFDVVIGGALGAIIAAGQIMYGDTYDIWITGGTFIKPLLLTLFILVLVRVHPEPADNCPCFDDSVAFAAVVIGVEAGVWHFASTRFSWNDPVPGTAPFDLETLGWFRAILRIILGVLIVFAWRGIMKPTLLRTLPPLFRVVESVGADLPRKFFLKASEYSRVPNLKKDDNIIPPAFDIPSILTMKLRNPLRRRAVSIGPQSEADAWETIAYRHKRRRESLEKLPKIITTEDSQSTGSQRRQPSPNGYAIIEDGINNSLNPSSAKHKRVETPTQINLPTPISSRVQSYEKMMGSTGPEAFPDFYDPPLTPPTLPADHGVYTPNGSALGIGVRKNSDPLDDGLALTATKSQDPGFGGPLVKTTTESSRSGEVTKLQGVREDDFDAEAEEEREQEIEREAEREIFERVERPRVRYDVEVVTKLIVYAGEWPFSRFVSHDVCDAR